MGVPYCARAASLAAVVVLLALGSGCQIAPTISREKLARRTDLLDTTGLGDVEIVAAVKASKNPPAETDLDALKRELGQSEQKPSRKQSGKSRRRPQQS